MTSPSQQLRATVDKVALIAKAQREAAEQARQRAAEQAQQPTAGPEEASHAGQRPA